MAPSDLVRDECVRRIKSARSNVRTCIANRGHNPMNWMSAELEYRNESIELRKRLLAIEVEERDALSIELQKKQLELEAARATTHET